MKLLKIALASSAMLMIVACSPKSPEPKMPEPKMETEEIDISAKNYDRQEMQHKLTFDKDILFVTVEEVNNKALHERPMGGISSQDAYVKNGNELYMFHDAKLPNKETNIIVMEKYIDDFDYQLAYELKQTNEDTLDWTIKNVDNEYVNNDNRLFLGNKVSLSELDNGEISITIGDKSLNIKPGSEDSISLKSGDVESEISVVNYGYLNSIKDMTYERLLKD